MQFVVGKLALAVGRRVQVLRLRTLREAADRRRHLGIEAADVVARAGDGDRVQQREEIGPQPFEQGRLVRRRPGPARGLPLLELALGHAEHRLDVADAQRVPERVLPLLGHQVDLVPQIAQGGVDRRRRKHQDLRAHAVLQDLFEQPVVAAAPDDGARFVRPVPALVAEVVGFVDDHQIERAPVEAGEVDLPRPPLVAAQVGVGEHRVVEPVLLEGVVAQPRPRRVADPVVLQPLGAQDQDPLVAQLEELDDRQRRPGLSEPHAVGDDAPVVAQQPVDGAGRPVPLEGVERLPDLRVVEVDVVEQPFPLAAPREPALEDVEQGLVVDELRRIGPAQAIERGQHVRLGVAGQALVAPEIVEPAEERLPVVSVADLEVELDVGRRAEAQPAPREVGTADQGRRAPAAGDVVELAVQEVGAVDRPDFDLFLDPGGAGAGQRLLRQSPLQLDAAVPVESERLGVVPARVQHADGPGLAVEKARAAGALQDVAQGVVGVDGEVGRHDRQVRAGFDPLPEEVPDAALRVVDDGGHLGRSFPSPRRPARGGRRGCPSPWFELRLGARPGAGIVIRCLRPPTPRRG